MKALGTKVAASSWRLCLMAVAATALTGSGAFAAGLAKPPLIPGPDLCLPVKNADARATCQLARTEYYRARYTGSLATINKALTMAPNDAALHVVKADILLRFDAPGPAEQQLREARKDGAPDHVVLPKLFTVMQMRHEETNLLTEFPEPPPGAKGDVAADILEGRAQALLSLARLPEAAVSADRSLSLSRDPSCLMVRSQIATKQNDMALADKLVDEAFRLDPQSPRVMVAKLHRLERAGDTAAVLALSDKMIALYPIFSDAVSVKARTYIKLNQDAKAQAALNDYAAIRPKSPVISFYRAVLASRSHNKKLAAELIQSLPPQFARDNPDLAMQMAQIILDNGNEESAAAVLGSAVGGAPDQLDLRLKLAELRLHQNSPQAALLVLGPVQDSKDPHVQAMLKQVRARVAKDRSF